MTEFWTQAFCNDAGLCGWPYALHYLQRAVFHLALVDPMLAVLGLFWWMLLADWGFSPRRRGLGFIRWVWVTAWAASFMREPYDAGVVDHWSKSYWDAATHFIGIRLWLEALLAMGPRLVEARDNIKRQRRNMARRRA